MSRKSKRVSHRANHKQSPPRAHESASIDPNERDQAIWQVIDDIHESFAAEDFETYAKAFHPQATVLAPGFSGVLSGRDAIVTAARADRLGVELTSLELVDRHLACVGQVANVAYSYTVTFREGDQALCEGGQEYVTLHSSKGGKWEILWLTQVSEALS